MRLLLTSRVEMDTRCPSGQALTNPIVGGMSYKKKSGQALAHCV